MRDGGRREEKPDWLVVQLGIAHRKISHGGRFAKEKGEKAEKAALLKVESQKLGRSPKVHLAQHGHLFKV